MLVWFSRWSRLPLLKNSLTVCRTASAVMPQYFWKKRLVIPSGPGALSGLMSNIALCISSSDGGFVSDAFMAGVTFSVIYWRDLSKSEGFDEVNKVSKYPVATCSTSSSVSAQVPFDRRSLSTRFLALRCLVVAWKNFVFRSPSLNQLARLFCFQ